MSVNEPIHLHLRTQSHRGVWCCLLVPFALWSAFEDDVVTTELLLKRTTLILSCFLTLASLINTFYLVYSVGESSGGRGVLRHFVQSIVSDLFERSASKEARIQRKISMQRDPPPPLPPPLEFRRFRILTALVLGLWGSLTVFVGSDLPFQMSATVTATTALAFYFIKLPELFRLWPQSFTFGEGCIVLQAMTLFYYEGLLSLLYRLDDESTLEGSLSIIAKSGLISCVFFCALPLFPAFRWVGKTAAFVASGIGFLGALTLPYLWWRLRRNPISWVWSLVISSRARSALFASWIMCVIIAVSFVNIHGKRKNQRRVLTKVRKWFHALSLAIFTSGIVVDPVFTHLSSVVALCVFIMLESMRFYNIKPFASLLTSSLTIFLDEKDKGQLILTPIYLLSGCSLPLWLCHDLGQSSAAQLLSGVLAVGVGDSAASVVGSSRLGRTRLPDSNKTWEGTAASVATQLAYLWALQRIGFIPLQQWTHLYIPIIIGSLVEALTVQVDNLILPIVLFALM